ncbi:MAG: sulfatase-like hydrolase/transferase [Spirochaetota bacterium]
MLILVIFFSLLLFLLFVYGGKFLKKLIPAIIVVSIIPSFIIVSSLAITGTIYHRSDFDVIFTTDLYESIEFVYQFISFKIVALLILYFLPLILLFNIKKHIKELTIQEDSRRYLVIIIVTILFIFIFAYNWKIIQGEYHVVDFYKSFYQFVNNKQFDIYRGKRVNKKWNDNVKCKLNIKEPKIFVLVIGESLSRSHMQVYGYQRETNPELSKIQQNLYIFTDVISPAVTTVDVMKYVLTFATLKNPESFIEKRSVVNLFKDAGFETIWIGNQSLRGNRNNLSHSLIAHECDQFYDVSSDTDSVVVDKLIEVLNRGGKNDRFIIIHLRGCHTKYSSRYPESFNYFDNIKNPVPYGENLSKTDKRIIDEYDNSVRYNDFIIYSIISIVQSKSLYSWVLYFSDHGEELFEFRDMFGHNSRNYSKYMCDIPFIVWVSENYKIKDTNFFSRLKYFVHRPYSTEYVIYSLSDLSRLEYQDFNPVYSIFSDKFVNGVRYVYNTKYENIPPISRNNNSKVVENVKLGYNRNVLKKKDSID